MVLIFSACMMNNLAGDSVYQVDPSTGPAGVSAEPEPETTDLAMMEIEYTESGVSSSYSEIVVEFDDGIADILHTHVDLACDMSPYTTEMIFDGSEIHIKYMPLNDERGCFMDVRFSMMVNLEEGTYPLVLMEDETEITIE